MWQFTTQIYGAIEYGLFSFENWYMSVLTMVIIHTELEAKKKNAGVVEAAARQGRWCGVGKVISELPQMLSW